MTEPDTPQRLPPTRFVPTLTEVVDAAPSTPPDHASPQGGALAHPVPDEQLVARQVLAALTADMDDRIADAVTHAVHEQLQGLRARVQGAVDDAVQDAIAQALVKLGVNRMGGKNP